MKILVSTTLIELYQYRFPKSKKVRIRKKWRKRKENYRERDVAVQFDRDTLFVSPSLFEKFKNIKCQEHWINKNLRCFLERRINFNNKNV